MKTDQTGQTGQMPSVIRFLNEHTGDLVLFCHVAAYIMTKIGISSIYHTTSRLRV